MEFTFDIDPNTTIDTLIDFLQQSNSTLISINPQPNLPLPSITIHNSNHTREFLLQTFF